MNPEEKPSVDPGQEQNEEGQKAPSVELHFEAPAGTRLQITVEKLPTESRGANLRYRVEFDPEDTALPATITLGAEDALQVQSRAGLWSRMARRWRKAWGAIQSGPAGRSLAALRNKLGAWAPQYQVAFFGLALLIYLLTRLIALEDFPIYFFTDEAVQTQLAADFIRDGFRGYDGVLFPTYFENASLFNLSLSVYVQVLPTFFFGKSVFVTRAVSVLITLAGVWAIGLILKNIYKLKLWWAGVLLLSITPVWFLHSRTAFETVIMVSMYAWFLYFYLLYREKDPKYLYLALLFGALTFYSYSPGQLIIVGTGLFLLFSDLRYHLKNKRTSLIGLGILILVAAPYARFQLQHSGETYFHLRMLNSYWLEDLPLADKLKTFAAYYTRALDPTYWYLSNEHDLARHRMDGMGNILWPTFPFLLIGLLMTLRRIKNSTHRLLVGATLMAPLGVSIVGIGITRVMALLVPITIYTSMGLEWVGNRIKQRVRPPAFSSLVFVVLALVNIGLLSTSLTAGPTWFSDYGLNGMQYGAQQVYTTAWEMLQDNPGIKISVTPTWANGADILKRFFIPDNAPIYMGNADRYLNLITPIDDNLVLVLTNYEYQEVIDSGKLVVEDILEIIPYPDGSPGFYFLKLAYVENASQVFAEEEAELYSPVVEQITLLDQTVTVSHPRFDMGTVEHVFDEDFFTLARTFDANPAYFYIDFEQPVQISGLSLTTGSMDFILTVRMIAPDESVVEFTETYTELPPDPSVEVDLDDAPDEIARLEIEIEAMHMGQPYKIHIRDLTLY